MFMRLILSVFIFILSYANFHKEYKQKKDKVLCEAFLLGSKQVKLFDKINGKEVGIIKNNYEEEIFYSVKIYNQQKQWFKVQAESIKDTVSGWLLNKYYLATYSRNYTDTLFVYEAPNKKRLFCSISEYFNSPMKIIECKKEWVKVEIENPSCEGWILQSMTCSSPYTTCN